MRIKATYHMIDNWEGEMGYMNVDSQANVWSQKGISMRSVQAPNLCGNSNFGDQLMNKQIDKIMEHNSNSVNLTFGSTLTKDPCDASYAIDNVMIFIRWWWRITEIISNIFVMFKIIL